MLDVRETIQEFSRELVNARQFKGITLEQVCDITKIQRRYLEAIEEGQWEILPQPYMEAFLKAYAETVGMNIPKVMKRYREIRRLQHAAEAPEGEAENKDEVVPIQPPPVAEIRIRPGKSWAKYGAATLIVIVLAGGFVAYRIFFQRPAKMIGTTTEQPVRPAPSDQKLVATDTSTHTAPVISDSSGPSKDTMALLKTISESLTMAPHEMAVGVNLLARARQRCWLRATLDRGEIKEALLATGDSLILRANEEVLLLIGNAGGLELEMDGESLGILGPPGKAVSITITPDGIQSQRLGKLRVPADTTSRERR